MKIYTDGKKVWLDPNSELEQALLNCIEECAQQTTVWVLSTMVPLIKEEERQGYVVLEVVL